MRLARQILLISVLLLPAILLAAPTVAGTWRGQMANDAGPIAFHLTNDAATVGGGMLGRDGKEFPISDGKLDAENISFSVAFEWQGMPVKLLVTGKVSGEQMQLHIAADNGYWATDAAVKREAK